MYNTMQQSYYNYILKRRGFGIMIKAYSYTVTLLHCPIHFPLYSALLSMIINYDLYFTGCLVKQPSWLNGIPSLNNNNEMKFSHSAVIQFTRP